MWRGWRAAAAAQSVAGLPGVATQRRAGGVAVLSLMSIMRCARWRHSAGMRRQGDGRERTNGWMDRSAGSSEAGRRSHLEPRAGDRQPVEPGYCGGRSPAAVALTSRCHAGQYSLPAGRATQLIDRRLRALRWRDGNRGGVDNWRHWHSATTRSRAGSARPPAACSTVSRAPVVAHLRDALVFVAIWCQPWRPLTARPPTSSGRCRSQTTGHAERRRPHEEPALAAAQRRPDGVVGMSPGLTGEHHQHIVVDTRVRAVPTVLLQHQSRLGNVTSAVSRD